MDETEVGIPQSKPTKSATKMAITNVEEELTRLVAEGEWDRLLQNEAFKKRSVEGQAMLINQAVDSRLDQLGLILNRLISHTGSNPEGGKNTWGGAVGVLERMKTLRHQRDAFLSQLYSAFGTKQVAEESKGNSWF